MRSGPVTNLLMVMMTGLCPLWCVAECAMHEDTACSGAEVASCDGHDHAGPEHGRPVPHHRHDSPGQPVQDAEHACLCTSPAKVTLMTGQSSPTGGGLAVCLEVISPEAALPAEAQVTFPDKVWPLIDAGWDFPLLI